MQSSDFLRSRNRIRLLKAIDRLLREANVLSAIASDRTGELGQELMKHRAQLFDIADDIGATLEADKAHLETAGIRREP